MLQTFDTRHKHLTSCQNVDFVQSQGVRAGAAWQPRQAELCNAHPDSWVSSFGSIQSVETTAVSHPSELGFYHPQTSPPCKWPFGEGTEVVTCTLRKSLVFSVIGQARAVLVCCCPEPRPSFFHELELHKTCWFCASQIRSQLMC